MVLIVWKQATYYTSIRIRVFPPLPKYLSFPLTFYLGKVFLVISPRYISLFFSLRTSSLKWFFTFCLFFFSFVYLVKTIGGLILKVLCALLKYNKVKMEKKGTCHMGSDALSHVQCAYLNNLNVPNINQSYAPLLVISNCTVI